MWACNVVIVEDDRNYYLLIYWFPPDTFVHALKKNPFTVVRWWYTPLFSALEAEGVGFEVKHGLESSMVKHDLATARDTQKSLIEKQKQNSFTWARVSTFVVMGLLMLS